MAGAEGGTWRGRIHTARPLLCLMVLSEQLLENSLENMQHCTCQLPPAKNARLALLLLNQCKPDMSQAHFSQDFWVKTLMPHLGVAGATAPCPRASVHFLLGGIRHSVEVVTGDRTTTISDIQWAKCFHA